MKKYLIHILVITLICTGISAAYTFTVAPVYSVSITCCSVNAAPNYDYSSSNLVNAQQELVNDYIEIIKSDKMLTVVRDDLKEKGYGNISVKRIRSMISAQQIDDTSVFTVTVSGTDRKEILNIANNLCENVESVIDETQQRSHAVDVLSDKALLAPVKVSPIVTKNLFIGAAIGFLGSVILFLIISYYDRTVRGEKDLKNRFELPIIGTIPSWNK